MRYFVVFQPISAILGPILPIFKKILQIFKKIFAIFCIKIVKKVLTRGVGENTRGAQLVG